MNTNGLSPREVAERVVTLNKHPERDEWSIALGSPDGTTGIQVGGPGADETLYQAYAAMLRDVVAKLVENVRDEGRG